MKSASELPDVVMFSNLLHDFAKQGDTKKVEEAFDSMRAAGMVPNGAPFSSLIENAEETIDKMKSASELPDDLMGGGCAKQAEKPGERRGPAAARPPAFPFCLMLPCLGTGSEPSPVCELLVRVKGGPPLARSVTPPRAALGEIRFARGWDCREVDLGGTRLVNIRTDSGYPLSLSLSLLFL
jgi:pentatricopeptide repeat protein